MGRKLIFGVLELCCTYYSAACLLSGEVSSILLGLLHLMFVVSVFLILYTHLESADNERAIFDAVLKGHVDFESKPWPSISESAKDLVRRMLTQDPKKRITAAQVLGINSRLPSSLAICF